MGEEGKCKPETALGPAKTVNILTEMNRRSHLRKLREKNR
jgi:hypothetical protein